MTVYNNDQSDFYIDDDGVSAFTDDNGETVIIADELVEVWEPRVFTIHFVAASSSTWNPADKYEVPGETLLDVSGGDLVITGRNLGLFHKLQIRSTTAKSAGKLYFEITTNVKGNQPRIGLASASQPMVDETFPGQSNAYGFNFVGVAADAIIVPISGGNVYYVDGGWACPTPANGDVWGVAVDFATTTTWLRRNGTWLSGDPGAGTGGFDWVTPTTGLFIWAGMNPAANPDNVMTLNTGGSAFAAAVPTGFTAWS